MTRTCHIHHAPRQHIAFDMRLHIETAYNRNLRLPKKDRLSRRSLARRLGLPKSTFCDEIRRGTVPQPNLFHDREVRDYSAGIAQAAIDAGNANKGRPMKMTTSIARLLRIEIAGNHRSPYDAIAQLLRRGIPGLPRSRCVYYHIHHGDIGLTAADLPYRPVPGRKPPPRPRRGFASPAELSIENRPDLEERKEFGHWEMDTIVSGVHGKGGLLVLLERKTRYCLIAKLRAITQAEVLRALRRLVRSGRIAKILTLTTDNGSEFLDHGALSALFKGKAPVSIYYTHAYSAWEKGSVENANRLVRRWYPKGTDFAKVSVGRIGELERSINSIARKLLEGKTAHEAYTAA